MNEQWFLLGDIHGSAQPVHYFYQKNKERLSLDSSENYMILLGDVGANFALTGQRDHKFKSELSKLPFTFICLRGNHEARVKTVIDKILTAGKQYQNMMVPYLLRKNSLTLSI